MTWIAVLKVDDLGRRPLLIGGVSGIVGIPSHFKLTDSYYTATCHMKNDYLVFFDFCRPFL